MANNYLKELSMLNVQKLHEELLEAGIDHSSIDSNGRILDLNGNEIQAVKNVKAIIDAHNPAPDQADVINKELNDVGATPENMIRALWKKVMQLENSDADALQGKMDQVNLTFNQ